MEQPANSTASAFSSLLAEVRGCTLCQPHLPLGARPILQVHPKAKLFIVGQAPGRKVHESGIPFDDASGDRLRAWLGITPAIFYNPEQIALLPMRFCYPGTGNSGDLPPRPECAPTWRARLLEHLPDIELTLLLGQYALAYHLADSITSVTAQVKLWRKHLPKMLPLPHPSPRNNLWLRRNPWFEQEVLPALKKRVTEVLGLGD